MQHRHSLNDSGRGAALKTPRSSYVHVVITFFEPLITNANYINMSKHCRAVLCKFDMQFTRQRHWYGEKSGQFALPSPRLFHAFHYLG